MYESEFKEELQQKCRDKGLPVSGTKPEIIERLRNSSQYKKKSYSVNNTAKRIEKISLDDRDKYIERSSFEVANSFGSSADKRNWLKEYTSATGKGARGGIITCCVYSCSSNATVGGHLEVKGTMHSKTIAIGPLCSSHNSKDKEGTEWHSTKANTTLWFLKRGH